MDIVYEEKIRQRAYEIWVAAGMTEGAADDHWRKAEEAVLCENGSQTVAKDQASPVAAGKAKASAKGKTNASAKAAARPKAKAAVRRPAKVNGGGNIEASV